MPLVYAPDIETMLQLIELNVGIGYMPHHLVKKSLDEGILIKKAIKEHKLPTTLLYSWRENPYSRALQWSIDYLKQPDVKMTLC